ncbi:hypothetical protein M0R45_008964 [Rubus argutus]|uniref:Uncharacterized protein n=1 Tax=Rubus argutus TaxID=59490 RepID=A0AAW1Y371_RUBAR
MLELMTLPHALSANASSPSPIPPTAQFAQQPPAPAVLPIAAPPLLPAHPAQFRPPRSASVCNQHSPNRVSPAHSFEPSSAATCS